MLPHKIDQSFISMPVSRVGLSTRLNQLNGLTLSRPVSRPDTPNAYVTSSLNPTRNLPVSLSELRSKISTKDDLEKFEALPITTSLRDFQATFNELSQGVSSFKEDEIAANVERLIDISTDISHEIDVLKRHQLLGREIDLLEQEHTQLDSESKHILKELIACRADLKKLPKLPANKDVKQPVEVSVQNLLNYAMKLAKFSKAPPTVMSQMIHPNNYVWPAEDALRRGMLAMASLKPDELIRAEIGDKQEEEDVEMEDVKIEPEPEKHTEAAPVQRLAARQAEEAPATLDLDLFDPDEDDSDSD